MRIPQIMMNYTKQMRREEMILVLLLVSIAFMMVVSLIYEIIHLSQLTSATTTEISSMTQITNRSLQPTNAAIMNTSTSQLPLFGTAPTAASAALSSLYTLIGTKYSPDNPSSAIAFIQVDDDSQVFMVGDTLPKGGIIENIDESGITVLYRGIKEKLTVPWDVLTNSDEDDNLTPMIN